MAYLKRIGTTIENERIGSAVVRTTARLAALQAGLPSIIVDKISSDNTLATRKADTALAIISAKEQMVRDFCSAVQTFRSKKYSALVQSAMYYMDREYAHDITVQALADQLDVSVNHIISVFKKETGVTPNVYLRQVRLRQAARILAATDQPVQEVASCVGILDANYLIRLFKAQYGETPTAYRKKYRV